MSIISEATSRSCTTIFQFNEFKILLKTWRKTISSNWITILAFSANPRHMSPALAPLNTETHGGDDVAIFANGPWSHLFSGTIQQSNIPHFLGFASCIGKGKSDACKFNRCYSRPYLQRFHWYKFGWKSVCDVWSDDSTKLEEFSFRFSKFGEQKISSSLTFSCNKSLSTHSIDKGQLVRTKIVEAVHEKRREIRIFETEVWGKFDHENCTVKID